MNKAQIDKYIPKAYEGLKTIGIADEKGEILKVFRGYISAFGAAIVMGSLRAAIAFNSQQNSAKENRGLLMKLIFALITDTEAENIEETALLKYVIENQSKETEIKENIYNAAIAIKLAMNMYTLVEENKK